VARRSYFNGLLAGGLMGAILSLMFTSRRKPNRKLMVKSDEVGNRARKVFRGISRGMMDMLRR